MLRRLRWVAILATLLLLLSVVLIATGATLVAIYVAVLSVFLLLADLVTRV